MHLAMHTIPQLEYFKTKGVGVREGEREREGGGDFI